ncbi:MAG TPA: HAD family hydrolase [Hyphomicrobiaceae bacterium]|nr:HAD family hydrolase [Hyphomicrobiaceae bacterium]
MSPALFLDRDGVVNVDRDYVFRREDFDWQPGIFDLARTAHRAGLPIVIVTNQSGIGRGYYSEVDFQALTTWMRTRFEDEGAPIRAVYHSPHHPEAARPEYRAADHPWRKPRPGMLLAARDEHGLDLVNSIMIGDRVSDIEAGAAAGVGTLVLVSEHSAELSTRPTHRFTTILETATWFAGEMALRDLALTRNR